MALHADAFSEPVRGILEMYAAQLLPLTRTGECNQQVAKKLRSDSPKILFPNARSAESAVSGLLLLAECWDESHEFSQDVTSREGSYWHGIAHRMEPDASNAAYWFRRVGEHPIFTELRGKTSEILKRCDTHWRLRADWDPFLFIEWCDEARKAPGSDRERAAVEIQRAEWELLFGWCAGESVQG